MIELLGKSKEALRSFCAALGEPAYRGGQIYHALYAESKFDFARMSNLPAALRERLAKEARVTLPEVKQRFASSDGSVRYLFGLSAGEEKGRSADTGFRRGGVHAERGATDNLHFDAGGMRGGLPLLPDGATRADSRFNGGRNSRAGAASLGGTQSGDCAGF